MVINSGNVKQEYPCVWNSKESYMKIISLSYANSSVMQTSMDRLIYCVHALANSVRSKILDSYSTDKGKEYNKIFSKYVGKNYKKFGSVKGW